MYRCTMLCVALYKAIYIYIYIYIYITIIRMHNSIKLHNTCVHYIMIRGTNYSHKINIHYNICIYQTIEMISYNDDNIIDHVKVVIPKHAYYVDDNMIMYNNIMKTYVYV